MEEVLKAGADGLAMISAIITKDDIEAECKKVRDIILKYKK